MYIITYKNRILNNAKKTYWCLLQVCSRYEKYQALLYCYSSPLFIKPGKKTAKFSVQVCGSKKSFAVADHPLLFCGICGCGIQFIFAAPSAAEKSFNCSARKQRSIVLEEQILQRCISKGIIIYLFSLVLLIETFLSVLQQHLFLVQIGWTNNQNIHHY